MIWLRAKDKNSFSKIVLTVTASNSEIKYQDHISLHDINEVPTQAALPSLPFRSLKFEGGTVITPYDHIETKVEELYDMQGNRINLYSSEKYIQPFDRLEVEMGLETGDVEKWGEIFNLQFIEQVLREEKIRLIFGGSKSTYYYGVNEDFEHRLSITGSGAVDFEQVLRKKLFSINWVVKITFWIKNYSTPHCPDQFT